MLDQPNQINRQRRHNVDQHLLVDTMTLPAHAQAPKSVQVHRPERCGAGFARHEWFSPLLLVQTCLCSLPSLAYLCWASCRSRQGRPPDTVLLSTFTMKNLIRFKRRKGSRGLTPRLQVALALVLVLCASSWRSCR